MARLFVANCTRQRQLLFYRLDFADDSPQRRAGQRIPPPKFQPVEAGRQQNVGGDLHMSQITEIVDQLNHYGMIGTVDLGQLKTRRFVPLIFSIDKPVPQKAIEAVVAHNNGAKSIEGHDRRQKAAVASNLALVDKIAEQPPLYEVEVEQLTEDSAADASRIHEGFRVGAASGPSSPRPKPRSRTPRRQAA